MGLDNRNKKIGVKFEEGKDDDTLIETEEELSADDPDDLDPEEKELSEKTEGDGEEEETETAGEDTILEDEEIDEKTGEIKKKIVVKEEKKVLPEDEIRYQEQRREATIVNEKNKQLSDAFKKANEIKDPTEDELKSAAKKDGFEWEELSNFEKIQFKKGFVNEQKLNILNEVGSKVSSIDEWATTIDGFIDDNATKQTNKALIGQEQQFRQYAMREAHRGAPINVLLSAFLHDAPERKPTRGSIMLTRGGGARVEKKNPYADADYVANLRTHHHKEYTEAVKKGLIKIQL